MGKLLGSLQPAVKKETARVAAMTFGGSVVMCVAFAILHVVTPESVPFDYTVILGALGGSAVAVLNFLMMGISVQSVAAAADDDTARSRMKLSYRNRLLMQLLWIIIAIAAPCFQMAAGIAPLLFPSLGIKLLSAAGVYKK